MAHQIDITKDFAMPVERLFAYLAEHENLSTVFAPAKITRLRDGDTSRNGTGSVRRVQMPGAGPLEETVTAYQENALIEYKITKGGPLRNHHGIMRFSSTGTGSKLHYTIDFEGKFPLVATIVRLILTRGITKGLAAIR
ncbi:SRPBCC family protein [Oleomonas cavernae]|uniref:SRPBCC family protein n=1 Tax=Oleomonas cavernae TaxID=2320859 RepID=A0A418WSX2_9PROT|nr:SRPBCC family protein [Oleomonas cavernae]RJF94325.1 SRPBCC family protein [Oleomonas cavernae]